MSVEPIGNSTVNDFVEKLKSKQVAPPATDPKNDEVLRVRIDGTTLNRLDAVVAFARGRGHRDVSRSSVMRDALSAYLELVEAEIPELLPHTSELQEHEE